MKISYVNMGVSCCSKTGMLLLLAGSFSSMAIYIASFMDKILLLVSIESLHFQG